MVGLINAMSNKIYYQNVLSDASRKIVNVPFFYNFSGDERFMQDYFSDWSDCIPQGIEGNYDVIPRGSLSITGISILSGNLTSRFVRGNYVREEQGELRGYNSYLNSIPLNLTIDVKILVDTSIDSFKITQAIVREFYKTMVYRVNFGGTVVPCQVGFPESYSIEKLIEYSFGEQNRIEVSFSLDLETYYPIFDPEQEMSGASRIEKTNATVSTFANPLPTPDLETLYQSQGLSGDSTLGIRNGDLTHDENPNTSGGQNQSVRDLQGPFTKDIDLNSKFSGDYWE
jgi:hypothetical protein